jgi:putative hydrolase of the HAD superfamily
MTTNVKGAMFDLDNTFYDYTKAHEAGINGLLRAATEFLPGKDFKKYFEEAMTIVKRRIPKVGASHNRLLYIENTLELLNIPPAKYALELYEAYWHSFLQEMSLFDGARDILMFLKERGVKTCLCSDLTAHIQYRKLDRLNISEFFDFIVTSEEAGEDKPSMKIFLLCLEKLNLKASNVIFVGDDLEKDIKGALDSGIFAIFLCKSAMNCHYSKIDGITTIESLLDLKSFIVDII